MTASLDTSLNNLLYDTPLSFFADIALNGTVVDLVDAARRAENPRNLCIISWVDSALSFAMTSLMALARLVHDLALTIFFALGWPFSASFRNSCKIHLARSAIDLVGAVGSFASIFYPPLIKKVALWGLQSGNPEAIERDFRRIHGELGDLDGLVNLQNKFFEKA